MQYRREIDGLRAVAVLPVILFHAGFSWFSGGFVGVDVFFVISGYLITTILVAELDKGTFSIACFYERRARRILPVLFFVMLCCIPFAWFWLLPPQFEEFSQSLIAVSLFASNLYFWKKEDYFAPAAEESPLLHTWSLAVEEQFYIFFPILLLMLWRFGRNPVLYTVIALSLISLAMAEYGWRNHATANFYLLPTRAWELGVGAICALILHKSVMKSSQTLSATGLGLILYSIFAFDESVPFPSLYALVPVVGTALIIIYAASDTYTAKFLSTRALVGIGLISFSAYLWHQPLLAFARVHFLFELSLPVMVLLSIASLFLAYLSWKYVEQPFRKSKTQSLNSGKKVFFSAFALSTAFLAFGAYGYTSDGLKKESALSDELQADLYVRELQKECFDFSISQVNKNGFFCSLGNSSSDPSVAIVGDSHSLSFIAPLSQDFDSSGISFIYSGLSGCPPLVGTYVPRQGESRDVCNQRNAEVFQHIVDSGIKKVILISRWTYYSTGDISGEFVYIGENYDVPKDKAHSFDLFSKKLEMTLQFFDRNGVEVVVFHQPPMQEVDARRFYNWAHLFGEVTVENIGLASVNKLDHQHRYEALESIIENKVRMFDGVRSVNFDEKLCPELKCLIGNIERSYYFDDDHLSNYGAEFVIKDFIDYLM